MFKFPIRIPANLSLSLAQPFRADTAVDLSTALSTSTKFHNGVDVVCGDPQTTWGKECVWPFPWPGVVYDAEVDAPFGATQHAHSQIDTTDPATGIKYGLIYIHLSAVTKTKSPLEDKVIVYNEGETIGKIGNNGAVTPVPTPARPYDGSHLHLGIGVKNPGELNYTMVDPLLYFNLGDPYRTQAVPFKFNKDLWIGMWNNDVLELQKRLGMDYSSGPGIFGPRTLLAVMAYQRRNGISPTGYVGPITRANLNSWT